MTSPSGQSSTTRSTDCGGAGDDELSGGVGDDTLIGGAQNDIDRLFGGSGLDTFLYHRIEGAGFVTPQDILV